jgi:hypothetical protein
MHGSEHASGLAYGLAVFYFLCFLLNAGLAAYYWTFSKNKPQLLLWGPLPPCSWSTSSFT